MALPQDKPNPVPGWATDLKASTAAPGGAAQVPGGASGDPSPDYSAAVAAYVHRAIADAMEQFSVMVIEGDPAIGAIARTIAKDHTAKANQVMGR